MSRRRTHYQRLGGWRPGGGRPRLPEDVKRTIQTKVMWNDSELARVDRAIAHLGFTGRADFFRQAALEMADRAIRGAH